MASTSNSGELNNKVGKTVKHFIRNSKGPNELNFVYKVLKKNTLVNYYNCIL